MISPHTRSYVHHVLIYICTMPLADEDVDVSVSCFDVDQFPTVGICQQSTIIGGWAVGGEVGTIMLHMMGTWLGSEWVER